MSEQIFTAKVSTLVQHNEFPYGAGHTMGTYRMETNPKTSAVGTGNPTLTIAALALRAAETILTRLQE